MTHNYNVLIATMGLSIGGAETHVIELTKGLSDMGVSVFVASNGGTYEKELSSRNIPHFKVPLHNKMLINVIKAYRSLERIITDNDIKLVHAHARIPAFLCGLLQKRMGFRLVTTAHFNFVNIFPYNLLTNWGQSTLAVSRDLKEYLIKNYNTPEQKIMVTVNGIDTERFCPKNPCPDFLNEFGLNDDMVKIVCVTRLDKEPSKIVLTLAAAAPLLYENNNKIRVIIIGDGNNQKAVKSAADIANAKTGDQVVILAGARTNISDILPAADIVVGISRSALEAMSQARPVILAGGYGYIGRFNKSALEAALNTNFTCRGCPDVSPQKLADDILALCNEPIHVRQELGELGRKTVIEHYSVARMCKDALIVYDQIMAEPLPASPRRCDCLLFGYYGSGNNGDDALLKSILDNLNQTLTDPAITVLSRKPRETAKIHNVKSIYLFNYPRIIKTLKSTKLLISGGGTLLQDITSTRSLVYYLSIINHAKKYGAKVMLYANGLGPVRRKKNKKRIRDALQFVDCITLRDNQSMMFLEELGLGPGSEQTNRIKLSADVAFSLTLKTPVSARRSGNRYFVAALRRWKYLKADFINTAAAFCDYMNETYNLETVFLPMQPSEDTVISRKIIQKMRTKCEWAGDNLSTDEILALVSGAEFVFSMRLHTVIYAAKAFVPAVAVVYDPKVQSMMEILTQHTYIPAEKVESESLKTFGRYVMENRDAISSRIREKTQEQTKLAEISIKCVRELLEPCE